ncbi:dihydrodipicolinate synthase family protein [Streptomyces sp. NPDC087422]|uniref:dihydrodipicolinate synthase family protein n=1 Tax=Streptomyces sp. NPDC087422 TaxID=3365786 RepID=UPI0037F9564C
MTTPFSGILAAVVTPFRADGSTVDAGGVRRQVEHIVGAGVHGVVPLGSTGEFTTLSNAERKEVADLYLKAVDGRVPVVVGTGALTTGETIDLTRHAADAGATAVMIVPPYYGALGWKEVVAHYGAVSDAVDIDIMFYNLPDATGLDISAGRLAELARSTRVTSFKDTGGDAVKFATVLHHYADVIQPLNGYDTLTFSGIAAGARAGVWGAASVIPQLCADFYETLAVRGDIAEAREQWTKIFPICEFLEAHPYASAIKTGLDLVGVPSGPPRLPALPLTPEHATTFARLLREAGIDLPR